MGRRKRTREVEIFNFSFLDILACTIGLLIFIMVMVFILQSSGPVSDSSDLIQRKLNQAVDARNAAQRDAQIADALEASLDHVQTPGQPDLKPQREAAKAARDIAQTHLNQANALSNTAQSNLDEAKLAQDQATAQAAQKANIDLASAQAANDRAQAELAQAQRAAHANSIVLSQYRRRGQADENFEILHVDCHAETLIMFKETGGKMIEVGRTASSEIDKPQSDFSRLLSGQKLVDNPLVLFWIRPDGYTTYTTAVAQLSEDTPHGFEPADANWSFATAH